MHDRSSYEQLKEIPKAWKILEPHLFIFYAWGVLCRKKVSEVRVYISTTTDMVKKTRVSLQISDFKESSAVKSLKRIPCGILRSLEESQYGGVTFFVVFTLHCTYDGVTAKITATENRKE